MTKPQAQWQISRDGCVWADMQEFPLMPEFYHYRLRPREEERTMPAPTTPEHAPGWVHTGDIQFPPNQGHVTQEAWDALNARVATLEKATTEIDHRRMSPAAERLRKQLAALDRPAPKTPERAESAEPHPGQFQRIMLHVRAEQERRVVADGAITTSPEPDRTLVCPQHPRFRINPTTGDIAFSIDGDPTKPFYDIDILQPHNLEAACAIAYTHFRLLADNWPLDDPLYTTNRQAAHAWLWRRKNINGYVAPLTAHAQ